jgi:hypothetical protein
MKDGRESTVLINHAEEERTHACYFNRCEKLTDSEKKITLYSNFLTTTLIVKSFEISSACSSMLYNDNSY